MAKVLGLDRLKRKLAKFPEVVEAEIRAAMEQSANEIVALMKSLAPVDGGALRESIGWTWGAAPKGAMVIGKVKAPSSGNMVITIYAGGGDAWYARLVEFGTAPHLNAGRFAGSTHPGTAAQSFFYPAYRANRKRAKSKINRAVTRAAKKVAAGNGKG